MTTLWDVPDSCRARRPKSWLHSSSWPKEPNMDTGQGLPSVRSWHAHHFQSGTAWFGASWVHCHNPQVTTMRKFYHFHRNSFLEKINISVVLQSSISTEFGLCPSQECFLTSGWPGCYVGNWYENFTYTQDYILSLCKHKKLVEPTIQLVARSRGAEDTCMSTTSLESTLKEALPRLTLDLDSGQPFDFSHFNGIVIYKCSE